MNVTNHRGLAQIIFKMSQASGIVDASNVVVKKGAIGISITVRSYFESLTLKLKCQPIRNKKCCIPDENQSVSNCVDWETHKWYADQKAKHVR